MEGMTVLVSVRMGSGISVSPLIVMQPVAFFLISNGPNMCPSTLTENGRDHVQRIFVPSRLSTVSKTGSLSGPDMSGPLPSSSLIAKVEHLGVKTGSQFGMRF